VLFAKQCNQQSLLQSSSRYDHRWLILGAEPIWQKEEEKAETSEQQMYSDHEMKLKIIDLLETKVLVLQRELRKLDPDLAKELGID